MNNLFDLDITAQKPSTTSNNKKLPLPSPVTMGALGTFLSYSISEDEKKSIEAGLNDAENGKLNDHSQARKLYEKWL